MSAPGRSTGAGGLPAGAAGRAEAGHSVALERYLGSWEPGDPHANFKRAVAEYTRADPLTTLRNLSASTGVPVGALARYALVRWTAEGSEALLSLGPRTVERMWDVVAAAEEAGTEQARLAAFGVLREMLSWLRAPLHEPDRAGEDRR